MGSRGPKVEGVPNATSNCLLDARMTEGLGCEQALAEVRSEGYAERDPSFDVEGWDTACKLLILAGFRLGLDFSMTDLSVKGI